MHSKQALNGFLIAAIIVVSLIFYGCPPRKPPEIPVGPPPITDAESLFASVDEQTKAVYDMDANLSVRLSGTPPPFRGKFIGTLRVDSGNEDLGLTLQVYSLIGAPVMEMIAVGDRVEVIIPLENTVFVNFEELVKDTDPEDFPLSSFSEMAVPLNLIIEQIGAIWGRGISERYDYEMVEGGDSYLVNEYEGAIIRRELIYSKGTPRLTEVRLYQDGVLIAGMQCENHPDPEKEGQLIPKKITLHEGNKKLVLTLSNILINQEVKAQPIEFRQPGKKRTILLTPPVP